MEKDNSGGNNWSMELTMSNDFKGEYLEKIFPKYSKLDYTLDGSSRTIGFIITHGEWGVYS